MIRASGILNGVFNGITVLKFFNVYIIIKQLLDEIL